MSDVDTAAPAVAEVVPSAPVPGTTDTPPTGTTPDPTPPEGATPADDLSETKVVKKPWYQKKIAEQAYQLRESQRLNERLLNLVESNRQTERKTGEEAPKPEQFTTLNEYIDAAVEYKLKNQKQPEPKQPQTQVNHEFEAAREDLIAEGLEKYEDFAEVIEGGRYITPIMANAIVESDNRVELARFLCTNHKEAQRIARLSPVRQAAEIGRIEDKLSARPVPPKKPSNAPAPVNPVNGAGSSNNAPSDTDDIGTWITKRQKQVHKR